MMPSVFLGADPEIFVVGPKNEIISASEILSKPIKVGIGQEIVNDGLQFELHPQPTSCREAFLYNLRLCIKEVNLYVQKKGLTLSPEFTKDVPKETLEKLPPEVQALGCEPDRLALTGEMKVMQVDGSKHFKRYAGGHIHLGFASKDMKESDIEKYFWTKSDIIIKIMDYMLGIPWVLLDHDTQNKERRKMYGQAGSYRIQPHGIEYRVLSNAWLFSPILTSLSLKLARDSAYIANSSTSESKTFAKFENALSVLEEAVPYKDICQIINENDFVEAKKAFQKFVNLWVSIFAFGNQKYQAIMSANALLYWSTHYDKFPFNKNLCENWELNVADSMFRCYYGWATFIDNYVSKNVVKDKHFTKNFFTVFE